MDYERFKEGFQDALKAELAVRGADGLHGQEQITLLLFIGRRKEL